MAYSFEGVSTHPNLRIKPKMLYIDNYGGPSDRINAEEGFEKAYGMIKNREPLKVFPSKGPESGEWSISSTI